MDTLYNLFNGKNSISCKNCTGDSKSCALVKENNYGNKISFLKYCKNESSIIDLDSSHQWSAEQPISPSNQKFSRSPYYYHDVLVCYHKIIIHVDIRAKIQHCASKMNLSDLVMSALGSSALVLTSLDQKDSFSRHSAESMHEHLHE